MVLAKECANRLATPANWHGLRAAVEALAAAPPTAAGGDVLAVQAEPPTDETRVLREIALSVVKERIERLEADLARQTLLAEMYLAWYHDAMRRAAAPAPLPDALRLTDEQIDAAFLAEPMIGAGLLALADGDTRVVDFKAGLRRIARALESALAVQPKVRLLTTEEVFAKRRWVSENDGSIDDFAAVIQRRFAEVNGLTIGEAK